MSHGLLLLVFISKPYAAYFTPLGSFIFWSMPHCLTLAPAIGAKVSYSLIIPLEDTDVVSKTGRTMGKKKFTDMIIRQMGDDL